MEMYRRACSRRPLSQNGFTLIELLVTVAVALLFVGGGLAGFITFNSRQKVVAAAREFEQVVKSAETLTQTGVVGVCTQLEAYEMTIDTSADPAVLSVQEVCAPGETVVPVPVQYPLSTGVTLNFTPATSTIQFKILTGGILFDNGATSVQAEFSDTSNPGHIYAVTISEGGDISAGSWL